MLIDYEPAELFAGDSVDRQLLIRYDGGMLTNVDIYSENFELTESLCSEKALRFGSCEASKVAFTHSARSTLLLDKKLDISMALAGHTDRPFTIGNYTVKSDKPTADRLRREIVAYDALYDVLNADVADWYNKLLPTTESRVTLLAFRNSFFAHFNIQQETAQLVNDGMIVEKTVEPSELSGKMVLTAILELNGCFGRINRAGKFQYVFLREIQKGLYPRDDLYPGDDLYPSDEAGTHFIRTKDCINCTYEDFETEKITKLQIRKEENDIGAIAGNGSNTYIIQNNFLVYGKPADDLQMVAERLLGVIGGVWYRPANIEAVGNPCLEPGDGIRLWTRYEIIYTYILSRRMKGIQALRDTYTAEGEPRQKEKVNSVRKDIIELKGRTNTLVRTVEETKLTIADLERGLSTQITQNAAEIKLLAQADAGLQSQITQNAANISSKVSKGGVVSEINQSAEQILLKANRLVVESTNFKLDANGNATFSGLVTGASITGGMITGTTITGSTIVSQSSNGNVEISSGRIFIKDSAGTDFMELMSGQITFTKGSSVTNINGERVYTSGYITCSGNLSCRTLNESVPITAANIGSYTVPSMWTPVPKTGGNGQYLSIGGYAIPTGDWVVAYCTKFALKQ